MTKSTKRQTKYRDADPRDCCGYCQYYRGGACSLVEGRILPYKICKLYKPFKNPRHGQYSIVKKQTKTPTDDWAAGE